MDEGSASVGLCLVQLSGRSMVSSGSELCVVVFGICCWWGTISSQNWEVLNAAISSSMKDKLAVVVLHQLSSTSSSMIVSLNVASSAWPWMQRKRNLTMSSMEDGILSASKTSRMSVSLSMVSKK